MLVHAGVHACFELKIENGISIDVASNLGFEIAKIAKRQKAVIFIHSASNLGINMQNGG